MLRYPLSSEDTEVIDALHALPSAQRELCVQTILELASQLRQPAPKAPSLHVVRVVPLIG